MAVYSRVLESVSGRRGVTTSGEELIFTGNRRFQAGDSVWTDGKYIYGLQGRHGGNMLFGGYYYPFYYLECDDFYDKFKLPTTGKMMDMSSGYSTNDISVSIGNTDNKWHEYGNFFVSGKTNCFFGKCDNEKYKIYDISNNKTFEISMSSEFKYEDYFPLDACVDDDGNLLTAFSYKYIYENSQYIGSGILVFKNDRVIKNITSHVIANCEGTVIGTFVEFVHLRQDGSLFATLISNFKKEYASSVQYGTVANKCNVDVTCYDVDPDIGNEIIGTHENIDLHDSFTATDEKSDTKKYSFDEKFVYQEVINSTDFHTKCFTYDSNDGNVNQIMDLIENHKQSHYEMRHIGGDTDKDYAAGLTAVTYQGMRKGKPLHFSATVTNPIQSPDTVISYINNNVNSFSFDINGCSVKCNPEYVIKGSANFYNSDNSGMFDSRFIGTISALGLTLDIGKYRIVDIKEKDGGGYFILTSNGLYISDGKSTELVCEKFKSWLQNFRVNKVSSSMISKIKTAVGGIK